MFTVSDGISFASQCYLLTFVIALLLAAMIKFLTLIINRLNKKKRPAAE